MCPYWKMVAGKRIEVNRLAGAVCMFRCGFEPRTFIRIEQASLYWYWAGSPWLFAYYCRGNHVDTSILRYESGIQKRRILVLNIIYSGVDIALATIDDSLE